MDRKPPRKQSSVPRTAKHASVGFIGLGSIGLPMAKNIVTGGFPLTVFDVSPDPLRELVACGARAAASPAAVGRECGVIGICVNTDQQVEQVFVGEGGLLGAARPDTIIAIHSTIRPRSVAKLASLASEHGVHVIDVGITGGPHGAAAQTLCYMAGGEAALIERCRPVFQTSAKTIVATGPLGSGMATKLCNNLITYLEFLAGSEAFRLAEKAKVPREALTAVTQANGVMTPLMQMFLAGMAGPASEATRAGREAFVQLAEKDLAITLEFARDLGVSLPATALGSQLMADLVGLKDRQPRC
jgi:3-hydroxyisobutyrate dehydrogenase-like beta-hydroxyacid dehydrogenase